MKQLILSFLLILIYSVSALNAQDAIMREDNHHCLDCHSRQTFTMFNDWTNNEERRLMNPYHIIDTMLYLGGVHKTFSCIDCHSMDYETYPHLRELKLEPMATCIDCHGGDPTYEHYQFDRIDEEFQKSVHFEKGGEHFTCNKCHNQHYYKTIARTSTNVSDIVSADNQMCLSCHTDAARYRQTTVHEFPVFREVHSWLPNHELHFRSVRCIDCHTAVENDLMISHNILSKEHAVKNCSECHSANSCCRPLYTDMKIFRCEKNKGYLPLFYLYNPILLGQTRFLFLNF
jgi:hypothetical protein